MNLVARFLNDRSGATAIEYALIASIVSIVIFGSLALVGTSLNSKMAPIADSLK